MKKIVEEYNVYTIDELKEQFPDGYDKAIEREQEVWAETTFYSETGDFLASIKAILAELNGTLMDWSIGIYDRSYLRIDLDGYMEQDNHTRNELVKRFTDMIEKEKHGACSFTGVYTDCYFFDGLAAYEETHTPLNYNNFHKAVGFAMEFAVSRFQTDLESTYEDNEYHEENLRINDYMFTEDGTFHS